MGYLKNVAIVGATGTIGTHIVAALLATNKHAITALTRHASPSSSRLPAGVRAAPVDYSSRASLASALRGQDVLIIALAPSVPIATHIALVEAAAAAAAAGGVRYVVPNGWGYDPASRPFADEAFLGPAQREVQGYVEEVSSRGNEGGGGKGLLWWISFVSGAWYEFSLGGSGDRFRFDFERREVVFFDEGTARVDVSTWEQTGRAVAALLSLPEDDDDEDSSSKGDSKEKRDGKTVASFRNKCVYFSSFTVSQRDMFESVLRVTGTSESDWKIRYEDSAARYRDGLERLKAGDRTGFTRALYARSFYPEGEGLGSGAFGPVRGLQNEVLGLPQEDLDERTRVAIEMSKISIGGYS
ncbi:CipA protein [Biscogniauxia marginata]|nr:CipA protein [Biscogniauxia marginata]